MIKKLTLITFVVFLALGNFLPHTIHAAFGSPSIKGDDSSSASKNVFSIDSPERNEVLYGCKISNWSGGLPIFGDSAGLVIQSGNYIDKWAGICKTTGIADITKITPEQITAYFQKADNNSNGGVAGILSNINAQLLDQRPASGIDYVNEKVYAITNPGKVYAADNPSTYYPGAGSELLRPIQGFWGWSVNLVFGFLVLLILVVAFAIMFRQRLGGAAEVTIQNAIPSIALAMILIPLSYAISGLFIDAITLGTNAVHGFLLGPQSPGSSVYANRPNANAVECDLQNTDVVGGVACDRGYYADDPSIDVFRARDRIDLRQTGAQIGQGISNSIPSAQGIFNLIGGILKLLPGDEDQFSEFAWFGNVINIIIGVLTIWIALKIFFKLINKYLTLLIMPVFLPFIFATAALPGNGTKSIVSYLKTMGSAALFYIVTYAMFILTLIFTDPSFQNSLPDFRTGGYIPPLLGLQSIIKSLTTTANSFPLTQLLMTLVGLGIYFSIPKTLDGIDEALGTKFVLPQLLKTPFESMQESFKVATRAFPSAVATVTRTTAGGVRGIAATGVNARFNAQRAIERAQGIAASDPRSIAQRRKNANIAKRQELLAELDKAGTNIPARAAIQSQLAQLDLAESLQGKEFSTKGEADKEREIKAAFSWSGTEKFLVIKESVAETWKKSSGGGSFVTPDLGELSIEAVNFTFPARIDFRELLVGSVNEARNIGLPLLGTKEIYETQIPGLSLQKAVPTPGAPIPSNEAGIFAPFKPPGKGIDAQIALVITEDNGFNTDNGKKIKFKLKLAFTNTNIVFGTGGTLGLLAPGQDIVTSKRAFKYGPYESNPVNAVIQLVRD